LRRLLALPGSAARLRLTHSEEVLPLMNCFLRLEIYVEYNKNEYTQIPSLPNPPISQAAEMKPEPFYQVLKSVALNLSPGWREPPCDLSMCACVRSEVIDGFRSSGGRQFSILSRIARSASAVFFDLLC